MEFLVFVIVFAVIFAVIFGALGSWIAKEKRRDQGEGFMLGLLFGPLGVLIEAVLPSVAEPPTPPTTEELDRQQEQRRQAEACHRVAERQRQQEVQKAAELLAQHQFAELAKEQHDARLRVYAQMRVLQEQQAERDQQANLQRKAEQRFLAIQRRRAFINSIPEGTKIAIGVVGGVLTIILLFTTILCLAPK